MQGRTKARVLAIMALVAVAIYSISCKPAWSPEGDKVAYIWGGRSDEEVHGAVAIYDLKTKQSDTLVEAACREGESGFVPIEVFWPRRGHELTYVSAPANEDEAGTVKVFKYDLRTKTTQCVREVAVPGTWALSSACPILLQRSRWLWIYGEDACFRVDVKRGKVKALEQAQIPLSSGGKMFFVGKGSEDSVVFGRIKTFLRLRKDSLFIVSAQDDEELAPVIAMPSRCTLFGCIKTRDGIATLMVFDRAGQCVKKIVLLASIDSLGDGYGAEWNPDGTVLWIAVEGEDEGGNDYFGIAEVSIAKGSVRIIKVNENDRYGDLKPLNLSLSPDGATLAVSMFSEKEVRLCLVDLTAEEREVTLIPPSKTAAPVQASETQ